MIEDLDHVKEIERKLKRGQIGEKKAKTNRAYYRRNAEYLKSKTKAKRTKVPDTIFEVIDGKLVEFFRIQHVAIDLGMSVAGIRSLENRGILMKSPFKGQKRGKNHDRLYTKEMRDIIRNCYEAARTVCGRRHYTDKFARLLKSKWIEAEIEGVW